MREFFFPHRFFVSGHPFGRTETGRFYRSSCLAFCQSASCSSEHTPLSGGGFLHRGEAADELAVGAFECGFGIDSVEPAGVDQREEEVAELPFHRFVIAAAHFGLDFRRLFADFRPDVFASLPVESRTGGLFAAQFRVEDDMQHQVAQLLADALHVAVENSVGQFVGLLDRVAAQRLEGLLAVPRALFAQFVHDLQQSQRCRGTFVLFHWQ